MIWYVEEGIGETRAVRLENGEIAEARLAWPGELIAGTVAEARLVSRARGSARGTAQFTDGSRALVDGLPPGTSQGAKIRLVITRMAMAEQGRFKLAHARPTDAPPRLAPTLAESLADAGHEVRPVRRFPAGDWDELLADAFAGEIAFAGGTLLLSPTPAMTLIDVDGDAAPRALALAACEPIARAVFRLGISGSIGVDFPTLSQKTDRRAVDEALARALAGWPHERTAMNGFGFVQLVARLERPSILHRASHARAASAARLLLRRAEMLEGAGVIALAGHPALMPYLTPEWLAELRRRTGRELRLRAEPTLAIEAPQAQLVGQ